MTIQTTMLDAQRVGSFTVYVDWSTTDQNKQVSVVVHVGLKPISKPNTESLSDDQASVGCIQNAGGNAHLVDKYGNTISNDKQVRTAAAAQHSLMKERISFGDQRNIDAIDQRIFDLLVPEGPFIGHYKRFGTSGGWERVDELLLLNGQQIPDTAISHIQSFTAPEHLNALAMLEPSNSLVAFEYSSDTGDQKPLPVNVDTGAGKLDGTPALVQTDQGLFHLLVPLTNVDGMSFIIHQVHTNETIQGPWKTVAELPTLGRGVRIVSIALVQADGAGSLKAVVRARPLKGSDFLASYQSDQKFVWQGPFNLPVTNENQHQDTIRNVAGSPGLVQSIFGDQEQLDLIVPIADSNGTVTLTQFTQPAGTAIRTNPIWIETAIPQPSSGDSLAPTDAGSSTNPTPTETATAQPPTNDLRLPIPIPVPIPVPIDPQTSINQAWTQTAILQPLDDPRTKVVSASIIQDSNRNLQTIAHVITPDGRAQLAFYTFDPKVGWSKPTPVTNLDGKPIVVGQDNGSVQGGTITVDITIVRPSAYSIIVNWVFTGVNPDIKIVVVADKRDGNQYKSAPLLISSLSGTVIGLSPNTAYEVYLEVAGTQQRVSNVIMAQTMAQAILS